MSVLRDNLLRLRLSDLSLVEVSSWPSDGVTMIVCLSKGQTKVSHFSLLTYSAFQSLVLLASQISVKRVWPV